jgi:hypothetical protein
MLFVPREPFAAALPGRAPPRNVPSDLVIAAASRILPADVVQKLVLLAIFALACAGAAALLDREPPLARLAAGVFYAWNPYVGERLIIGQWALLLGYAGLPWVLRAVLAPDLTVLAPGLTSRRGVGRLVLALLPAVTGGFAAMAITALVAVPAALLSRRPALLSRRPALLSRRARRAAVVPAVVAVLAAGSLPWLIPSLLHPVYVDPASVAAFAARADTPFGSVGSLLMLGGAWNAQTVPTAYGGPWSALWLAAVLLALASYLLIVRPAHRWPGQPRWPAQHRWPGLGLAAAAGLVIACLGLTAPGRDLLRSMIATWPGFAILRDAQQFVAPLALAEATGFGLLVTAALTPAPFRKKWAERTRPVRAAAAGSVPAVPDPARPVRAHAAGPVPAVPDPARAVRTDAAGSVPAVPDPARPARADAAGIVLAVVALLAPVLLLPGLAWGAAGRLRPAAYPAAWLAAARSLDADAARGSVLLLPWATYRTPPWNHGETVLDPWTRLLSRPLIWNDGTQVGGVALAPDDPRARALDGLIRGRGPLTAALRAAGVRFVLDDPDSPDSPDPGLAARLPGSAVIINQPGLTVYQLP